MSRPRCWWVSRCGHGNTWDFSSIASVFSVEEAKPSVRVGMGEGELEVQGEGRQYEIAVEGI